VLDDVTLLALVEGLNFSIIPLVLPIEDIVSGVEKAVSLFPVKAAEEF
jgi:hypothetical protein